MIQPAVSTRAAGTVNGSAAGNRSATDRWSEGRSGAAPTRANLSAADGMADDAALVQRAKAGDRDAFVSLYRRYVDELFGYAYHQLGDVQDAEDVTSETFLRLVTGLGGFDQRASFRTWLYTIARNQLRDRWRAQSRRPSLVPIEDDAHDPAGIDGDDGVDDVDGGGAADLDGADAGDHPADGRSSLDGADGVESSGSWAALGRQVMAALPSNYRQVLTLRVAQGRSIRDAAEVMGTTPGNVKVLQHRALKRAAAVAAALQAAVEVGADPTQAPAGRSR
ncbi:MAG: RNA polymerase sigma factor [Ardenticatenales bacterium]